MHNMLLYNENNKNIATNSEVWEDRIEIFTGIIHSFIHLHEYSSSILLMQNIIF